MAQKLNFLDKWAKGEDIVFDALLVDRGDSAIDTTGATITMTVSDDAARTTAVFTMNASPEVTLVDSATGRYQFHPSDANALLLLPGVLYYYDIFSNTSADGDMHQFHGAIMLRHARGG